MNMTGDVTVDTILAVWLVLLGTVGLGAAMTMFAIHRMTEWSYERETTFEQRLKAIQAKRPNPSQGPDEPLDRAIWTGEIERQRQAEKFARSFLKYDDPIC